MHTHFVESRATGRDSFPFCFVFVFWFFFFFLDSFVEYRAILAFSNLLVFFLHFRLRFSSSLPFFFSSFLPLSLSPFLSFSCTHSTRFYLRSVSNTHSNENCSIRFIFKTYLWISLSTSKSIRQNDAGYLPLALLPHLSLLLFNVFRNVFFFWAGVNQ